MPCSGASLDGGLSMRRVTQEMLDEERLALNKLEQDWPRINRNTVNRSLRDSLFTRINELRASVGAMEAQMRKYRLQERAASDSSKK